LELDDIVERREDSLCSFSSRGWTTSCSSCIARRGVLHLDDFDDFNYLGGLQEDVAPAFLADSLVVAMEDLKKAQYLPAS